MNHTRIIEKIAQHHDVFYNLLHDKSKAEYLWKKQSTDWCLLEVICHLYDEEREDFRTRVRYTLEDPTMELPKFNPLSWVTERNYIGQDYQQKVSDFLEERNKSVRWLRSLQNPSWHNAYQHPRLGPMSAGLFLANWLAHDYLHIRQINKLMYGYHAQSCGIDLRYAGDW